MAPHSRHHCCLHGSGAPDRHDHGDGPEYPAWRMLLSHHPPCDLNRTWRIFGLDVCVRCLAMAATGLAVLALALKFPVACAPWKIALCLSAMIPAGIDFTLEELVEAYPQSNALRFATGCVFGAGGAMCLAWWIGQGLWTPTALFVACALAMQLAIAFIFRWCGHLEDYLAKYEDHLTREEVRGKREE